LGGRRGAEQSLPGKQADDVWQALSANLGSLVAFFDALILSERLPLIDYGYTYESRIGFEQHELYRRCNNAAQDQLLVSVHVMMDAYQQSKTGASIATCSRYGKTPEHWSTGGAIDGAFPFLYGTSCENFPKIDIRFPVLYNDYNHHLFPRFFEAIFFSSGYIAGYCRIGNA
jgi:hypothetical protein